MISPRLGFLLLRSWDTMVFTVQLTATMDACNDTLIGHQCNFTKKAEVLDLKDAEPYSDSWVVVVILGVIALIMGIVSLIKRQAKLKERQRREEEYLAYFHSVLPQSQLYGKHEQADSIWSMMNTHNGFNNSNKQKDMARHFQENFSGQEDDEVSLTKMFTVMRKYSLKSALQESFDTAGILNTGFHNDENSDVCDSIPGISPTSELESESVFSTSGVSSAPTEVTCIVHCEQDDTEPVKSQNNVSRYVSHSEIRCSDSQATTDEEHINESVGIMQKMLTFTDLTKIVGSQQDLVSDASMSTNQNNFAVHDPTTNQNTQHDLALPSSKLTKEDIYAVPDSTTNLNTQHNLELPSTKPTKEDIYSVHDEINTETDYTDREIQGILTFTNLTTNPNIRYNLSPSTAVRTAKPTKTTPETPQAQEIDMETNHKATQGTSTLLSNADSDCYNDESDKSTFIWI